jgi:CubicO group peptidase (beta-lactamase class C family)
MEDHLEPRLVEVLHKLGLTEQMLRDHVIRADIFNNTVQFELHEASDELDITAPSRGWFYQLNVQKLQRDLHNLLSPCTVGYSMKLRRNGKLLFSKQWGKSKMPGDEGSVTGVSWSSDTPMHVASVSKLVTAMAMTKLLNYRNISLNAHILPYLPKYWAKGPGVDQLTFNHLLTHKSGLVVPNAPGACDYLFMKDRIAQGVSGMPGYLNINYALCRILISTIDAPYLFDPLPTTNDNYWDLTTTRYFTRYITENIFDPAGVGSTLDHPDPNALAYPIPVMTPGWNSGDLKSLCAAVGWHLSVNDLLSVMAAFRRAGSIVDPAKAQIMLDRQIGIDKIRDTSLGRIYAKGGFWGNGSAVEQSNVFFLPKGMELAILANSPFCSPNTGFMDNVLAVIEDNIELNLFTVTMTAASAVAAFGLFWKAQKVKTKR